MLGRNGRYVVAGKLTPEPQSVPVHLITTRRLSVFGQFSGGTDSYYRALEVMRLHQRTVDWDRMLSNRYGLDELTTCMERMRAFDEIKPVIVP